MTDYNQKSLLNTEKRKQNIDWFNFNTLGGLDNGRFGK